MVIPAQSPPFEPKLRERQRTWRWRRTTTHKKTAETEASLKARSEAQLRLSESLDEGTSKRRAEELLEQALQPLLPWEQQLDELRELQRKLQPYVEAHVPMCFLRGSFVIKMSPETVVEAHDLLMKKGGDSILNFLCFSKQLCPKFAFTSLF